MTAARVVDGWRRLADWAAAEVDAEPMRWPGRLLIAAGGVAGVAAVWSLLALIAAVAGMAGVS